MYQENNNYSNFAHWSGEYNENLLSIEWRSVNSMVNTDTLVYMVKSAAVLFQQDSAVGRMPPHSSRNSKTDCHKETTERKLTLPQETKVIGDFFSTAHSEEKEQLLTIAHIRFR